MVVIQKLMTPRQSIKKRAMNQSNDEIIEYGHNSTKNNTNS